MTRSGPLEHFRLDQNQLDQNRRPLASSLIDRPGYHGLMTQGQVRADPEPLTPAQRLRQVANLANGTTPLGLAVAAVAGTAVSRGPRGLVIASGYRWRFPYAGAFTLGNVVICRIPAEQLTSNAALLGHEEKHCSQYAWCMGLPFLPLYFLAAGWSLLRTGDPASGNFFEEQAGLAAGGYGNSRTRAPAPGRASRNEA